MGDEECDEPSGTVKSNEEIIFRRTKPEVVLRRSLLTELIRGNNGGSRVASCSSPESRRPRSPNSSRASAPRSTQRQMISEEMIGVWVYILIFMKVHSVAKSLFVEMSGQTKSAVRCSLEMYPFA